MEISISAYIIDAIIGFSIVYKALDNMGAYQQWFGVQPNTKVATFLFGLLHGVVVLEIADFSITQVAWFWLVMLVILSTVIPSFMMVEALDRIGATQTGIVGMLGPILTIVLAIYLLDEPFSVWLALGVALMMMGVANLMRGRNQA